MESSARPEVVTVIKNVKVEDDDKNEDQFDTTQQADQLINRTVTSEEPFYDDQIKMAAVQTITAPAEYRVLKTIALYVCFLALGLSAPLVGSTIVHMEILLGESTRRLSFVFTGHSLGYTVGAWFCGIIFDRTNQEFAFFFAILIESLATIAATFAGNLYSFIAVMCIQGLAMGFLDAAAQSYCVCLWFHHRLKEPLLQAAHAVWSLGATIGPFLIQRFLVELRSTNKDDQEFSDNVTTIISMATSVSNAAIAPTRSPEELHNIARARYAYLAVGLCMSLSSVVFGFLFFRQCKPLWRGTLRRASSTADNETAASASTGYNSHVTTVSNNRERCFTVALFSLIFAFFWVYLYIETLPSAFFPTFVLKRLLWSVQDSTFLMSIFFGFHSAGRFIGVPLSAFIRPRIMLIVNITMVAIAYILLLFVDFHPNLMWGGAALAGLGMASTFASTVLWLSETMAITGRVASLVVIASSIGGLTGPVIVGQLMDNFGAMWLMYVLNVASLTHIVLFAVLFFMLARRQHLMCVGR